MPRERFDRVSQILKPRYERDQDVTPHNLLIAENKNTAHRLHLRGFLKRKNITIDELLHEFSRSAIGIYFITFMDREIEELIELA